MLCVVLLRQCRFARLWRPPGLLGYPRLFARLQVLALLSYVFWLVTVIITAALSID